MAGFITINIKNSAHAAVSSETLMSGSDTNPSREIPGAAAAKAAGQQRAPTSFHIVNLSLLVFMNIPQLNITPFITPF